MKTPKFNRSINYYSQLGVASTANLEEIKNAFRKFAKQTHPDVASEHGPSEFSFESIHEAYSVLSNNELRKQYDTFLRKYGRVGKSPILVIKPLKPTASKKQQSKSRFVVNLTKLTTSFFTIRFPD